MLVLSRRQGEAIEITTASGELIVVKVVELTGGRVRFGLEADPSTTIDRGEIAEAKRREQRARRKGGAA
jgi:carbon storage regulator CsrA